MDIQTDKIELAKLLLSTNNHNVIQSIKQIFEQEQHDFWDDLSVEQKQEIEHADLEIEQGKTSDYETFMSKHR